jgi:hypothetical protein
MEIISNRRLPSPLKSQLKIGIVIVLVALSTQVFGQVIYGQNNNLCPELVYNYYLEATCAFTPNITVTGGTIVVPLGPTGNFSVRWNNVSTGQITASCWPSWSTPFSVTINANPVPAITNTNTPINCGTGVMRIYASQTANTTNYIWSLPSGVTAPSTITTVPYIDVSYTAMGGGDVKVASINANCNNNQSAWSSPYTITRVSPPNPTLTKSSSNYEICNGESWTITASSSFPSNYGYDWYITYGIGGGSGVLIDGQTTSSSSPRHTSTNQVTLSAPSGYGTFFVSCRLNNLGGCTSGYVNFQGQAGTYSSSQFSINGPSSLCPNSSDSYVSGYIGYDILDYKWGWSSGFVSASGQGTPYLNVSTAYDFSSGVISLQLQNRCGYTGSPKTLFVSSGYCGYYLTASPNPASSTLNLTVTKNNEPANPDKPIPARLVDSNNITVWAGTISEKNASIDVSSFKAGTYYLKFMDGTGSGSSVRIIIDR